VSQGKLDLRSTEKRSSRGNNRRPSWTLYRALVSVGLFLALPPLSAQQVATHPWPVKILQRLLVPFRSNPFSQSSVRPCRPDSTTCFSSTSAEPPRREFEPDLAPQNSSRQDPNHPALLIVRTGFRGPLAHHWLELDAPDGDMTFGFGPATLPFIDSGEVSLFDRYGNTKWISGMHPLPWLALPPVKYRYAPAPGEGIIVGKPIPLTTAQSQALTRKLLHMRFVGPYIPIFHDCRTFTCAMQASAQGHSTVPCYLLAKGYW
jgi:hypothetical protein